MFEFFVLFLSYCVKERNLVCICDSVNLLSVFLVFNKNTFFTKSCKSAGFR